MCYLEPKIFASNHNMLEKCTKLVQSNSKHSETIRQICSNLKIEISTSVWVFLCLGFHRVSL